jgi:hypothetical protein
MVASFSAVSLAGVLAHQGTRSFLQSTEPFRESCVEKRLFLTRSDFEVGARPTSLRVGDFDGNGWLDAVVANSSSDNPTISVILRDETGALLPPQQYTIKDTPRFVAVGDLNNDSSIDIVVTSYSSGVGDVSVFLGNGDGTFYQSSVFAAGGNPSYVVLGDFNDDGKSDMAVANSDVNATSISLFIGNGDGTFGSRQTATVGRRPTSIAVGDFDEDGIEDLVVAAGFVSDEKIVMLLGVGDGSFQSGEVYKREFDASDLLAKDLNLDGSLDLIVSSGTIVSIFLGGGDGSLSAVGDYAVTYASESLSVVDIDGDGNLDVLSAGGGLDCVGVLLGRGDGSFWIAQNYSVGTGPNSLAVVDWDNNGSLDILTSGDRSVSILKGDGDEGFPIGQVYGTGLRPQSAELIDLDRDGLLDFITANSQSGSLSVLYGDEFGGFTSRVDHAVGSVPHTVKAEDLNGDGWPDLVVTNSNASSLSVLINLGARSFLPSQFYSVGQTPHGVAIGDVNNDGHLDLAIASISTYAVTVLFGLGDGTFHNRQDFPAGVLPDSLVIVDLNNDGYQDAVVTDFFDSINVLFGSENGFVQPLQNFAVGEDPTYLAASDFNGDGNSDLAVVNYSFGATTGSVSILLGNGFGAFSSRQDYPVGTDPFSLAIGDLNADGVSDIVVANAGYQSESISILIGDGNGSFYFEGDYLVGSQPRAVGIGDVLNDGVADVVVANYFSDDVTVLLGRGVCLCRADADQNGVLNFFDIALFIGRFQSMDSYADFNGDGFYNFFDIATYVSAFGEGCE